MAGRVPTDATDCRLCSRVNGVVRSLDKTLGVRVYVLFWLQQLVGGGDGDEFRVFGVVVWRLWMELWIEWSVVCSLTCNVLSVTCTVVMCKVLCLVSCCRIVMVRDKTFHCLWSPMHVVSKPEWWSECFYPFGINILVIIASNIALDAILCGSLADRP